MSIKDQNFDETDIYVKDASGIIETETWPLPSYQKVEDLDNASDYELISMYQKNRDEKAIMCLAYRYQALAMKVLGVMKDNWEQPDRVQTAFVVLIETVNKIKLNKINPKNYQRCLYLWFKQGLLNAIRDYKKQLGDVREGIDDEGNKIIIQYVGFDETLHQASIDKDETGIAMAKLELWDLFNEDEALAVELYISGIPFSEQAKRSTLYRLLASAKKKIIEHYKESGIIIGV